jgi:hypothetical protein
MDIANQRITTWLALNNPDEFLYLDNLGLEELPPIPDTCRRLSCPGNKLTTLPKLPNCVDLMCHDNLLTSIPPLPNCEYLYCINNKIKVIGALPKCRVLTCSYNKLTTLPELPECTKIFCPFNEITQLPNLPKCEYISCFVNKLTTLPDVPRLCEVLCSYNNLLFLPRNCGWVRYYYNAKEYITPEIKRDYNTTCDNKYLCITKQNAEKYYHVQKPTANYYRYAKVIQRSYRKYLRRKYSGLLNVYILRDPAKIICLYVI